MNEATYNTVSGGDGVDTISLSNVRYSSISGGASNDTIVNIGYGNTISGGEGNDIIGNYPDNIDSYYGTYQGNVYQYADGDGNDTIFGFDAKDTIQIASGSYSTVKNGEDILVNVGEGYIYLEGAMNLESFVIVDESGAPATIVPERYPTVLSSGADSKVFGDDNATVYAIAGNDYITLNGSNGLIDGGDGNDRLVVNGAFNTLIGGADNDVISLGSSSGNTTIIGGAGADTIYTNGNGNLIQYVSGKDVIVGFGENDTIEVTSDEISVDKNGNNVLVTVGSGSSNVITLTNVPLNRVVVEDGFITLGEVHPTKYGDNLSYTESGIEVELLGGNDTVTSTGDNVTLNGGADNDIISLGADASGNLIINGDGNDTVYTNGNGNLIQYVSGKDVIVGFGNEDTIQIDGTISRSVQSGSNVVITVGDSSNVITLRDMQLSHVLIDGNVITYSEEVLPTEGDDNLSYTESGIEVKALGGNDTVTSTGNNVTINGGAGNDVISLGADASGNLIQYAEGDGKDTIVGFGKNDTIEVTSGTISVGKSEDNVLVTVGSGSNNVITLTNVSINNVVVEDGFITLGDTHPTDYDDNLSYTESGIEIDLLKGNDTVTSTGNNVTINGGAGNDVISLGANASGNLIQYAEGEGNDVVYGFGDSDTIRINGTISSLAQSDGDVIISVGSGKITIKNKELNEIMNRNGDIIINPYPMTLKATADTANFDDEGATVYAIGGNDVIENTGANSYIDGGAGNDKLFNSGENVTLLGGDGKDTLRTSASNASLSGGAGDDIISLGAAAEGVTIAGGAGNDSIYTNALGNLIQYGSGQGKDTIYGWGKGDSIEITAGSVIDSVQSGSKAIFYKYQRLRDSE